MKNRFWPKNNGKPKQKYIYNMSLQEFELLKQLRIILLKTLHPKFIYCCKAPRSMLSNYFGKKQVLRATFGEILYIQIQMYL